MYCQETPHDQELHTFALNSDAINAAMTFHIIVYFVIVKI